MVSSTSLPDPRRPQEFVRRVIAAWQAEVRRAGAPAGCPAVVQPSAADLLRQFPELRPFKSVVLDLAYEEYCLRKQAAGALDPGTFSRQFPTFRRSLERLLLMHDQLVPILDLAVSTAASPWPEVGERLAGFELVELLGQGGTSRVYMARQAGFGGRDVVLKVSPFKTVEADAVGRLSHPHIVPILSQHFVPDGPWALVCMPLLGRQTLADLLDAQPATRSARDDAHQQATARCIRQLADALALTHQRGLLHGDLKPSNVLIDFQGSPRLMDFHLATEIGQATMSISGTIPYMPPELLAPLLGGPVANVRVADPRSDLYSLGVMLVETLTGQLPFGEPDSSSSFVRQIERQLERRREPQAAWDKGLAIDRDLLDIARSCLAYDLEQRILSAATLRDRLDNYLADCHRRRSREIRARRSLLIGGGAVALAAVLLGASAWITPPVEAHQRLEESSLAMQEYQEAHQLYSAGQLAAATQRINVCLRLVSADPRLLVARGHLHRIQGYRENDRHMWEQARLDYERALQWEDSGPVRACAMECCLRLGRHEAAIKHGEQALQLGPESAGVHCNLGLAYTWAGRPEGAEWAIKTARRLNPTLVTAALDTREERHAAQALAMPGDFPFVAAEREAR